MFKVNRNILILPFDDRNYLIKHKINVVPLNNILHKITNKLVVEYNFNI